MALDDLQWSYRGLTFGAGTDIHVNAAEGFEGFEVRMSDSDLPRGDGGIRGVDYVDVRTISFELLLLGLTGADLGYEEYWAQIREAFRPSREGDFPLTFKRPGQPERVIYCRPVQLLRKEDYRGYNALGFPPVVLRAVDPRIYAAEARSLIVPVYTATETGFNLPAEFPFDFTGGQRVEAVALNNGTAPAYPLVRFYHPDTLSEPVYYPADDIYPSEDIFPNEPDSTGGDTGTAAGTIDWVKLTNTTTGAVLEIETPVVDGQILIADMTAAVTGAPRLVVSMDDSSRYGAWKLPRADFALAPGSNVLRFEVSGTTTTARCHVQWSDTWLD